MNQVEDNIHLREELLKENEEHYRVLEELSNIYHQFEHAKKELKVLYGIVDNSTKQLFVLRKNYSELTNKLDDEKMKFEISQREAKLQHDVDLQSMENLKSLLNKTNEKNATLKKINAQLVLDNNRLLSRPKSDS